MYRWCFETYNDLYLDRPILHLAFLAAACEQWKNRVGLCMGPLCWEFWFSVLGEVLFPGSIINLLWHRMDDILCLKHSITRTQQMSQLPLTLGMKCILLLIISDGRLSGPQIWPVPEATDCPALSSLSCDSHHQAAEVIGFLCCWLLRCRGCFLYRMGRSECGARTAPPTQFSSHGFLLRSPLSHFPSLTSHKWLWDYISAPGGCSDFMTRAVITCTIPVIMALWAHTCQPLAKVRAAHLFL